jgi:phage-related minor tail protein
MAGDRTLSLKLLADTKNLVDGLNKGAKSTESFGKQIGDISAKVVKSFVAIGAAVGALSLAFAKAAAEDQQAANRLAQTLGAVTNATEKQIQTVGRFITQTSLATGITDDELRPAFERLARSTKNVDEAQTLLNLALDLSAATSAPLEQVTNALGKAYDGNYTSLNKLGLGIDQSIIKTKDFNRLYETLNGTFGEFSERRSEEALVKFQKLQRAIEEAKEAVGAALLPVFERLGDWLLNEGVPKLNAFIAGLVGDKSLSSAYSLAEKKSEEFGQKVRGVFDKFVEYKEVLKDVAIAIGTVFVVSKITAAVQATIAVIQTLIKAYNALRVSALVAGVASMFALNPVLGALTGAAVFAAIGGAIKLFESQDIGIEGVSLGGASGINAGGGERAGGFVPSLGGGASMGMPSGSLSGGFTSATGGGAAAAVTSKSLGGFSSLSEVVDRLTEIDSEVKSLTFKYNTGQLTKAQTQKALDALAKETNAIEKIANSVGNTLPGIRTNTGEFRMMSETGTGARGIINSETPVIINVNAPSIIDEDGFTRAIQNAQQNAAARGTLTGGL